MTYEQNLIKQLADSMKSAIDSGDWCVDGRNDPEILLDEVIGYLSAHSDYSIGDNEYALKA